MNGPALRRDAVNRDADRAAMLTRVDIEGRRSRSSPWLLLGTFGNRDAALQFAGRVARKCGGDCVRLVRHVPAPRWER